MFGVPSRGPGEPERSAAIRFKCMRNSDTLRCTFCGKSQNDVQKLIAGPTVYICNECVDTCNEIIGADSLPRRRYEGRAERLLRQAAQDFEAARLLQERGYGRAAAQVYRSAARMAMRAYFAGVWGEDRGGEIEGLLVEALRRDEDLRRLQALNVTSVVTQHAFDDELSEAGLRSVASDAELILQYVLSAIEAAEQRVAPEPAQPSSSEPS